MKESLEEWSIIYIEKQDIRIYIYVAYSRPNGWADWAEFFCGNSWVGGVVIGKKNRIFFNIYFFQFFLATGNAGPFS